MNDILTPSERVARIINMITPYAIWYSLLVENEEAGDTRIMIHLEYCVVHPADLIKQTSVEVCNAAIHSMNVDWLDDTDETFMQKLEELHLYLQYCNWLSHQDNYHELSTKEKAEFVERNLKRHKEAKYDGIPF